MGVLPETEAHNGLPGSLPDRDEGLGWKKQREGGERHWGRETLRTQLPQGSRNESPGCVLGTLSQSGCLSLLSDTESHPGPSWWPLPSTHAGRSLCPGLGADCWHREASQEEGCWNETGGI